MIWSGVAQGLENMTVAARRASSWDQLSDGVLSLMTALIKEGRAWRTTQDVLTLSLVCTRFRDFVSQHPRICNTLRLGQLKSSSLPSLLLWLQQHAQHVTEYWNSELCQSEMVLGVLLSHQAPLQVLKVDAVPRALHTISAFTQLTACTLRNFSEAVDLEPYQALEQLIDLRMYSGEFTNLHAAAVHLTRLEVEDGTASCSQACMCVTSLQHLCVENAKLAHFHNMGLSACCNLEFLDCDCSSIGAGNAAHSLCLSEGDLHVPASLTALSKLTMLWFTICTDAPEVTLDWVTGLTTLQHLEAYVRWVEHAHVASMVLPASWSCMTNLRKLSVSAYSELEEVLDGTPFVIKLGFDWKPLVFLVEVKLSGTMQLLGQCNLTSLVSLFRLEAITIEDCIFPDVYLLREVAALAHQLGKTRPNVTFTLW